MGCLELDEEGGGELEVDHKSKECQEVKEEHDTSHPHLHHCQVFPFIQEVDQVLDSKHQTDQSQTIHHHWNRLQEYLQRYQQNLLPSLQTPHGYLREEKSHNTGDEEYKPNVQQVAALDAVIVARFDTKRQSNDHDTNGEEEHIQAEEVSKVR